MDKLSPQLLDKIDEALGFKLYEWQKNYLLDIPTILDLRITSRRTGKTLVYIIKLLFSNDELIRVRSISEMAFYSDSYCIGTTKDGREMHYYRWFREELVRIYTILTLAGIKTRPVLLNFKEEVGYNKMKEGYYGR